MYDTSCHELFYFFFSGKSVNLDGEGPWFDCIPESEWMMSPEEVAVVRKFFKEPYGDRRVELVFIGMYYYFLIASEI